MADPLLTPEGIPTELPLAAAKLLGAMNNALLDAATLEARADHPRAF